MGIVWGVCAEAAIDWGTGTRATVSGGTVTLTSAEERAQLAALDELQIEEGATLSLAFGAANAVTIKANISGAGHLTSEDSKFTFTGDNRAHTGNMAFSNSWVYVTSRHGLGLGVAQGLTNRWVASIIPTAGGSHTYKGALQFSGEGCTTDANLVIGGYHSQPAQYLTPDGSTLTLNGWMTIADSFTAISFGDMVANGTFYHSNRTPPIPWAKSTWYHTLRNGRTITVNSPIDASLATYFYWNLAGTASTMKFTEGMRGSAVKGGRWVGLGRVLCEADDVLWGNDAIDMSDNNASIPLTLDLNGHDQWCSYINQGRWDVPHKGIGVRVASDTPATLTMTNSTFVLGSKLAGGVVIGFTGKAGFHYAGTGGYTISNVVSDTEGSLRVSKGALSFVAGAGWEGPQITVDGTGVLKLGSGFKAAEDGALRLAFADQGRMELAEGLQITVSGITTNGIALPGNCIYSAAELPDLLSGGGSLKVLRSVPPTATYTWTGAGADDNVSTAANWAGGSAPDLFVGNAQIVVSDTATRRTLVLPAGESFISGLEVNGAGITVRGADASSKLLIDKGAFRAVSTAEPVTNVFEIAVEPLFPQLNAWYFGANTRTEFARPLVGGVNSDRLVFEGVLGEVALKADNAALEAELYATNVMFYCWTPTSLGGTNRYTWVNYQAKGDVTAAMLPSGSARVQFQGPNPTNSTPLAIANTSMWSGQLCFRENADYPLVFTAPLAAYYQVPNVSFTGTWTMLGGFEFLGGNFWNYGSASGRVYVKEKPINQARGTYFILGGSEWHVYTTGNSYNFLFPNGRWVCEVEDCLTSAAGNGWLVFSINAADVVGTIDLNGYDQHVERLGHRGRVAGESSDHVLTEAQGEALPANVSSHCGIITSEKGGTLYLMPRANDSFCNQARVTGNASLVACGVGTNAFQRGRWTTTGSLAVQSGTLAFIRGAGWDNASQIQVSGGTLRVGADSAETVFGPEAGRSDAELVLSGTGTLQLEGGVSTVRMFMADGRLRKCGYYGSQTCTDARVPPQNKLAAIQGAGVLHSLSGTATMIIFR